MKLVYFLSRARSPFLLPSCPFYVLNPPFPPLKKACKTLFTLLLYRCLPAISTIHWNASIKSVFDESLVCHSIILALKSLIVLQNWSIKTQLYKVSNVLKHDSHMPNIQWIDTISTTLYSLYSMRSKTKSEMKARAAYIRMCIGAIDSREFFSLYLFLSRAARMNRAI